jgi:hypothetical protein
MLSLVGSEMCIRDRLQGEGFLTHSNLHLISGGQG